MTFVQVGRNSPGKKADLPRKSGSLAGVPTIAGAWIGGLTFSPELSTLFLAMGAGAIFQVIYEVGKLMLKESGEKEFGSLAAAGLIAGLVVMYLTGLFVVAS